LKVPAKSEEKEEDQAKKLARIVFKKEGKPSASAKAHDGKAVAEAVLE
jgi:hypothetical protein